MAQSETVFHTGGNQGIQPDAGECSTGSDNARKTPSHSTTINSNGNTWLIQHMRSDLICFIEGQAAGHIDMLVVATEPNCILVVWSTDGCIIAALKAVSQHLCDRRIVHALAFHRGRWGVRPKSPVMPQPPRLVDLLYREDPHILCLREACQRPSLPSLFGMPYGHSLSC